MLRVWVFRADYEGVKDALGDACACSFSCSCVMWRKTRCGAMAGAACCDDRCSALRWPMQRAAPKEAWFCFRQVRSSEGKLGGGAAYFIKRCSGFLGMLFWVSWYAVLGFLVCCSGFLGMLFRVSRHVVQGLSVSCSRSLGMLFKVSSCAGKRARAWFGPRHFLLPSQTNKEWKWRVAKSIPYYNICARGRLSALPDCVLRSFFRSSLLHCSFLLSWGRTAGCCGAEARMPGRSEQATALRQA